MVTYTAAKIAPTKMAPNVFPRLTCGKRSGVGEAIVGRSTAPVRVDFKYLGQQPVRLYFRPAKC